MSESNIVFRPIKGSEQNILATDYHEGWLYFATDTKKIYLDANGEEKLPMGGNSGIYYGQMELEETPDEGQTEFTFDLFEIEGNEDPARLNIPNVDDLILNIPDGCFYRVILVDGEGLDTVLTTEKLTIAGAGGGGGTGSGGSTEVGTFTLDRITPQILTILFDTDYSVGFNATAIDSSGEVTGNGTYELYVGGVKKISGTAYQGDNYIPVGEYLALGENKIRLVVYMDVGGSSMSSKSKNYTITTTEMKLVWDYDETKINYVDQNFTFEWSVSGTGIKKTTNILIDDLYEITLSKDVTTANSQIYTLTPTELISYNLIHGAHKIKMWVSADLNGNIVTTNVIYKNIMFIDRNNSSPVISCGLFTNQLIQYNTTFIPIIIYSTENISSNATVILQENGIEIDKWENVANQVINQWSYTPTKAGTQVLTVQCGTSEVTLVVQVAALNIDNNEVPGYIFKFKASDFASNTAVQNWQQDGVNLTFSEKFDWINGGLKSEDDEKGNNRQFVSIKAGSTMTINYPLFKTNAKSKGKNLKVIFKATNCRDYDAEVLKCKRDIKLISINTNNEIFLPIEDDTELIYSNSISIDETGQGYLSNPHTGIFNKTDAGSRNLFKDQFINYDGKFYKCNFALVEGSIDVYYTYWYLTEVIDNFEGFLMRAQSATLNTRNNTISTQYCEDTYIELEFDITSYDDNNVKNYIKYWIDGVPSGFVIYDQNDSFIDDTYQSITIGSSDCDVYIYMIKVYEKTLTDNEHLQNFIADAPNAEEMIARYKRNDILDERGEISPTKLALANSDCLVHVYNIARMTTTKKDKVKECTYDQYHNSDQVSLHAENVTIKVQGTSSEKYVVSAANIDADFEDGFTDTINNTHLDGWSMDGGTAIPVDYFCTKVNVASCENANNALNQWWYDAFQPYKTVVKCKNPGARDTMQFTNGVVFMVDNNKTFDTSLNADKKLNNVFGEIPGYINNPYPKMYSIGNMGNSKKNIKVFHDTENELECCVEVADNQTPQQWMVSDDYEDSDIDDNKEYFGFRYPDGAENATQEMKDGWRRFVSWMAHSNPQPKYEEHKDITDEAKFNSFAFNQKTQQYIPVYILNGSAYELVDGFTPSVNTYYTETEHIYGYTNLPLKDESGKNVSVVFEPYKFKGYKTDLKDSNGELWQKDYNPIMKGFTVTTYAGTYTHDTYEYRMAKMLSECEDYLVMDSVIYHYLFIERHCMIDNVAKNTFWSTEDCMHWNLTKDYDNDTADGNDNNGKFTRNYGMEPLDKLNANTYVFNAHQAVWLNFIDGLQSACQHMYQQLENIEVEYNGRTLSVWDKDDYLWLFKEWQSRIPERCWIEDHYRKYFRPYELYNDTMFISMMEGGQKTYQRKQFETYEDIYMSSEYHGKANQGSYMIIRSNGKNMLGYQLPVEVYNDCYIRMDTGSDTSIQRVKRNTEAYFECPTDNLNNATMYFYPAKAFSKIGKVNGGKIGYLYPEQISFAGAGKLREIVVATIEDDNANESLKEGFDLLNNVLLEKVYVANLTHYTQGLNLSNCPNLKEVDARNSTFTSIQIANNAPVETIKLNNPTSLDLSNLSNLKILEINNYGRLSILKLNNIDNDYISSKDIVENSSSVLNNYKLTNVNWTMINPSDIDTNQNTIKLLEMLLTKKPIEDPKSDSGFEPLQNALTGNLMVEDTAYNGDHSFEIYNTYAQEDVYPNLDINFESLNSKLYSVQIYDGNNNVLWNRKIKSGENVDADFLKDGPQGAFKIESIYKSSTPAEIFAFTGIWHIYENGDLNSEPIILKDTENLMPYYNNVTSDIIIIPQFSSQTRYYEVKFFGVDTTVPFETNSYAYGTPLSEILPNEIPYKESPNALTAAWDFKGYGLVIGATNVVPNNYTVTNNQSFYAIFEYIQDIRKIVHYDWFDYIETTYTRDEDYPSSAPYPQIPRTKGYLILPKVKIRGKVTIPSQRSETDTTPIIKIGPNFASINSAIPQEITHIFCAENSKLYEIGANAFNAYDENHPFDEIKSTLQYFDFSQNTVRFIDSYAFSSCPLEVNEYFSLSENIFYIGEWAFNAALKSKGPVTVKIPGNIELINAYGFNNLGVADGSTLQVGSVENYSKVNLLYPAVDDNYIRKFTNNMGVTPTIYFYSTRYSDFSEELGATGYQVYRAFIRHEQIEYMNEFTMTIQKKGN